MRNICLAQTQTTFSIVMCWSVSAFWDFTGDFSLVLDFSGPAPNTEILTRAERKWEKPHHLHRSFKANCDGVLPMKPLCHWNTAAWHCRRKFLLSPPWQTRKKKKRKDLSALNVFLLSSKHSLTVDDTDVYYQVSKFLPAFHPSSILFLGVFQKDKHSRSTV